MIQAAQYEIIPFKNLATINIQEVMKEEETH